jgi:ribosomal protein S18 acetylase RimI-like enzyme
LFEIEYVQDRSSLDQVLFHLLKVDTAFKPSLSERVELKSYATKLYLKAVRFEAFHTNKLVGLLAVYINESSKDAFITNVSVLPEYQKNGIASNLLSKMETHLIKKKAESVDLEVFDSNYLAAQLYIKFGFYKVRDQNGVLTMRKWLNE